MKSKGGIRWETTQFKEAIKLFGRGCSGTQQFLSQQLRKKLQRIKMEAGGLGEVFDMLGLKVDGLTEMERECVPTRDEIALSVELHLGKEGELYFTAGGRGV